tara:strand:+ start:1454 stop:2329 length:876 start_codon:yes stop_codon:yes gene_type:complete
MMTQSNILENVAMLVRLNITRFGGEKIDTIASEDICKKNNAESDSGKFIKKLFKDNQALKDTKKIASKARHVSDSMTLPYMTGQKLLAVGMYEKHGQALADLKQDFEMARDVFISDIKKDQERQKIKLGSLYNESDYPNVEDIRDKFTFTVQYETIADCQKFDTMGLGKLINDAVEIQNKRIDNAVMDMFKRIEKYLGNFAERTKNYKPKTEKSRVQNEFRDTLISNLRELVENLPVMNITNNPKINELCDDIKGLIKGLDLETLRGDEDVRKDVSKKADDILAKMGGYCG